MKLSKIEIKNFKSFNEVSIDLNDFNIIIGACASGKSNFIEIFKFLKDIPDDFRKAISKHGGQYLKNFKTNSIDDACFLKAKFNKTNDEGYLYPIVGPKIGLNKNEVVLIDFDNIEYELKFNFKNLYSYEIIKEIVTFHCSFYHLTEVDKNKDITLDENHKYSENDIILKNIHGKISAYLTGENEFVKLEHIIHNSLLDIAMNKRKKGEILIIDSPLALIPIPWSSLFKKMSFYDINPKLCKSINAIGNDSILNEHGSNLSIILDSIIQNDENRRKFLNLVKNILPYIEDITIENIIQDHKIFQLVENFNDFTVPAQLISDGTGDILALIVALYFEKSELVLIEEPERNIHPALLSKIVQMMEDASRNKQIIITTHSPEVLKSAELKDIFLISRNTDGFSQISKPIHNKTLKPLIEELGIDEVYVDNYFGD